MSHQRIHVLNLPPEMLKEIVRHVAVAVTNYRERVIYVPEGLEPMKYNVYAQEAARKTGIKYECTLLYLHATCRQFRALAAEKVFEEVTLWQSTRELFGHIQLEYRQFVRSVKISTLRLSGMSNRVVQKHLAALFSLLPLFQSLSIMCFEEEEDWEHYQVFTQLTSSSKKRLSPGFAHCASSITRLDINSGLPNVATPSLRLFPNVRHLTCRSLTLDQQQVIATTWPRLISLTIEPLYIEGVAGVDQDFACQEVWAGTLRTLEMYVTKPAVATRAWRFILNCSESLEVLKFRVRLGLNETIPAIPPVSAVKGFPRLKKLTLGSRTSEMRYLLALFATAPLQELVLHLDDEGQDEPTSFEESIQPFFSTLRLIRFYRPDQPFIFPSACTPSFIDLCERHSIKVARVPCSLEHLTYYDVFEVSNHNPQEESIVRGKDAIRELEALFEYGRRWLRRCKEEGDFAGVDEISKLMRDMGARSLADHD